VENGAAFSTGKFIVRCALTPALSQRERGLIRARRGLCRPRSVENGAAFSTGEFVVRCALTPALSQREREISKWGAAVTGLWNA